MPGRPPALRRPQTGLTYLWALFAVMLLGLGLGKALEVHHQQRQREKEAELLYIGEQYRQAIRSYYLSSPGTVKRYPSALQDLLLDRRLLTVRRHIRRLYPDPITGTTDWGVVRNREGGILGVHSLSQGQPLKQANFPEAIADFGGAEEYRDWKFEFRAD